MIKHKTSFIIYDTIGEQLAVYRRNGNEGIPFKLHIGHTHNTHLYLLKNEDTPL